MSRLAAVIGLFAGLASLLAGSAAAAEPVVPGFYRLREEAKDASPAELGQLLIAATVLSFVIPLAAIVIFGRRV
jgi:hypothetical protein